MSICSLTPQHGGYKNFSLLEGDVKVRKCHTMLFLRNWWAENGCDLDHSLQNNSGNRDNKTYVLCPTLQTRTCIGVLKSIIMFFHSFIALEYPFTLFFSLLIARRKFHGKGIKWKTFPEDYVFSLCGVVVRCSRVESKVRVLPNYLFLLSFFFRFLCCCFL